MMNIDDIITLKSGDNYLLLELLFLNNENYFFGVKVNSEKNKAIGIYEFIKVIDSSSNRVEIVKDIKLKEDLYRLLSDQFKKS